jgi:hypothetical protein
MLLKKILHKKAKMMKEKITKNTILNCTKRIAELKNSSRLLLSD